MSNFEKLCSPFKIGNVEFKNRFCVAPMATGYLGSKGEFSPDGIEYFVRRAKGGFGLIFSGAFFADNKVDPYAGGSPLDAPLDFRKSGIELNSRLRPYGAHMFLQISMGLGRNAEGQYGPSEIPYFADPSKLTPALSLDQIKQKIECVVHTAALAKASGFPGVEVHSIHWGYLLDQFTMSLTNKRTDEYGGSLENRLRVSKEILEGIKQVCGADYPVTMRLGLKTYIKNFNQATLTGEEEGGRTLEEGVRISKLLESYGYDALNVDTGVYDAFYYACPPMYVQRGYMVDLAAAAKAEVNIPILCGSRMGVPDIAEQAIKDGKLDAIVLGRPSLADPDFPQKVEMGRPDKIRPCISCNQGCLGRLFDGLNGGCAVNPEVGRGPSYRPEAALRSKKVVVVGGGVAGMEVARTAALRGHDVSLYEKNELGGHLVPGGKHEFKAEVRELNDWYKLELADLKVDIHLGEELSADDVKKLNPDTVALAVGSAAVMPDIPGIDHPKAVTSIEALKGSKPVGEKIVVVGGGLVGCEMALEYIQQGKQVTIVEAMDAILSAGDPVPLPNMMMLYDLFAHHQTPIMTGHCIAGINDQGAVVVPTAGGPEIVLEADTVVIAIGFKPQPSMAGELRGSGIEVYQVGDGNKVGNVQWAIWEAYEVAQGI